MEFLYFPLGLIKENNTYHSGVSWAPGYYRVVNNGYSTLGYGMINY